MIRFHLPQPLRHLALAVALLGPVSAAADEIWLTEFGLIQWETSRESIAVLNLIGENVGGPGTLRLFVEGLGDHVFGERSVYRGYWTAENGDVHCSAALTDPMRTTTRHWGRLQMVFLANAYPSAWVALLGECLAEPEFRLTAQPLTDLPLGEP